MKNIAANIIRHEDKIHIKEQKVNLNAIREDKSFVLYKNFTLAVKLSQVIIRKPKSIDKY